MSDIEINIPTGAPVVVQPAGIVTGAELVALPESLADLAALFARDEPTPREVMAWILEPDEMEESDPEESARAIILRILSAETAEDVLRQQDVKHAADILGLAFHLDRVSWQRSDHQQSSSCYAVIHGRWADTGDGLIATCGGRNVMTQLLKVTMLGGFPGPVRIMKATKPTARGYYPLWLDLA